MAEKETRNFALRNKDGNEIDVFTINLPLFEKGIGASVSERFNISHVNKSETDIIKSSNRFNNTMVYGTALDFEGIWDIKNVRGWSINMNRSEEFYSGSFKLKRGLSSTILENEYNLNIKTNKAPIRASDLIQRLERHMTTLLRIDLN